MPADVRARWARHVVPGIGGRVGRGRIRVTLVLQTVQYAILVLVGEPAGGGSAHGSAGGASGDAGRERRRRLTRQTGKEVIVMSGLTDRDREVLSKHVRTHVVPAHLNGFRRRAECLLEVVDDALSDFAPHYPPLHFAHVACEKLNVLACDAERAAVSLRAEVDRLLS